MYIKILLINIVLFSLSCKNADKNNYIDSKKNVENIITTAEIKQEEIQEFSNIDFFNISGCCLEKKLDLENNRFQYSFNSKVHDYKIFFYPHNKTQLTEKEIEKDISTQIKNNTVMNSYKVYVLFFSGENLEPIYEGYDEPSYYDYTFPAKVKLYKLIKDRKWLLLKEKMVTEDEYYNMNKFNFQKYK